MQLNEETIFNEALDIADAEERRKFLHKACRDNEELRRQVERLLDVYPQGDALEPSCPGISLAQDEPSTVREHVGDKIGPYKLLEQLGEGGMGIVYMAEQTKPIRRKVALKIIKVGMDTGQVIARFESERQALALMNHPNIAKVLDAGETETGRPYFVMELVRGIPITEFCDQQQLSSRQRLELFIDVCEAVQHAHQKGIIHRDIKPSNVMVELHDVKAVPKVIDFGIAKATNQQLTERTLFTQFSQMIGTPMYMSPEQAQLSGLDIDTRSDVYSLGVLLYELLTRSVPFDRETFKSASFDEMRRIIREDQPPLPSHRISTLEAKQQSTVAERQGTEVKQLRLQVERELDWIVMKSLEKDRTRRYDSASAFGRDVRRFLDGDLVQACPPSVVYRMRKYSRRHKAAIVTASLVAAAMLIGTGVSVWQAVVANRAKVVAEDATTTAQQASGAAKEETEKAKAATAQSEANLGAALDAVDTMLKHASNPELRELPQAQEIVEQILTDAITFYEQFKTSTGDSPDIQYRAAMTRVKLGFLTLDLRQWEKGTEIFSKATDELENLVEEFPTETRYRVGLAQTLGAHAHSLVWGRQGAEKIKRDRELGIPLHERQKSEYERLLELDPVNRESYQLEILESELGRAGFYRLLGDIAQASAIVTPIREVLKNQASIPESIEYRLLVEATRLLATTLQESDPERSKTLYRESVELGRAMLTQTANRQIRSKHIEHLGRAANFLLAQGNIDEAERYSDEGITVSAKLVSDFPHVPQYHKYLHNRCSGGLSILRRKLEIAEAEGNDSVAKKLSAEIDEFIERIARDYSVHEDRANAQASTPNNIDLLTASIQLYPEGCEYFLRRGGLYRDLGEYELAFVDLNRAIELLPHHPLYPYTKGMVAFRERGDLYSELLEYEKAIDDYSSQIEAPGGTSYKYSFDPLWVYKRRARAYFELGKYIEALADLKTSLDNRLDDLSALTWISPAKIASCPDREFRAGILQLADRAVELTEGSAGSLVTRGVLLLALGHKDRAIADWDKANELGLDSALACNNFAWAIASDSDVDPQLLRQAVWLAEEAVSKSPESPIYRNTLGVVQYRAADFAASIDSLEKSEELSNGDHFAYNGIFIAMANWQIGNQEQALAYYDKSIAWREKNETDEKLDGFCAEAEKLLGIAPETVNAGSPQ